MLVRLCPITGFVHTFLPRGTIVATGMIISIKEHKSIGDRAAAIVLWEVLSDNFA